MLRATGSAARMLNEEVGNYRRHRPRRWGFSVNAPARPHLRTPFNSKFFYAYAIGSPAL